MTMIFNVKSMSRRLFETYPTKKRSQAYYLPLLRHRLPGLKHMEYGEQLNCLILMTLEKRRLVADMTFIFKLKAGLCSISLHELGLSLVQSCTRGADVRFNQLRPSSTKMSSLFQC